MRWSNIWPYARTWWGTIVGVSTILLAIYYGPRKMLETWDWYMERFTDSKVRQFLKDHRIEIRAAPDKYGQSEYARRWTTVELAAALKFRERRVARSLERLRIKNQVRCSGSEWEIRRDYLKKQ
jgi:hypothetical protein